MPYVCNYIAFIQKYVGLKHYLYLQNDQFINILASTLSKPGPPVATKQDGFT